MVSYITKRERNYISVQKDMLADNNQPLIGVYWLLNGEQKDTVKTADGSVILLAPDQWKETELKKTLTLESDGEYTLSCYAFADGYYSSSASVTVTAVTPETVVSGNEGQDPVPFGEQTYWTISRSGKKWTANNLYNPTAGVSYRQCDVLDRGMGRLYSWTEAQTLCPAGWHLPTVAEFQAAFGDAEGNISAGDLIVNALFQGSEMWTYNADVRFTNLTGFSALPAGYVNTNDLLNTWNQYGHYACFWTADANGDMGTYLYIYEKEPQVRKNPGDKNTLYLSVRCTED